MKTLDTSGPERPGEAWDRRQRLDPTFWMAEDVATERELWASGERDFKAVTYELPPEWLQTAKALDIGCGAGRLLRAASAKVGQLTGLDVSAAVLAEAKTRLGDEIDVTLVQSNSNDFSVLDEHYDFIYSFAVLAHLTPARFSVYLCEVRRLMHAKSRARLQVYLGKEVLFARDDTFSLRSYEQARFESACHLAGFRVESITPIALPYDGVDMENDREPVIVSVVPTEQAPATSCVVLGALIAGKEVAGRGEGSRDEYRFLITHANMLIRECKLKEAEKFIAFAVECYQGIDDETKFALELIRLAAE